jgi:alkaline phosphatase D
MSADPTRRTVTLATLAGLAASMLTNCNATRTSETVATEAADVDPHPASNRTLTRIAFGSCAHEDKEQPIWDAVLAARPDLFIFLGDNVYGDTRDPEILRGKYAKLAAKPGFQRLRAEVPLLAIWDDHDYGENDAGSDYPMKEESRQIFCDFWGEAASSARRTRDGIYVSHVFGPVGQRVQVILPDLRWNRTPIREHNLAGTSYDDWIKVLEAKSLPVPGPYAREPDLAATMLGEAQWQWLETQLRVPADVRILASSLQVVADFPGWEAWINYARDHQRLIQAIRDMQAKGLVCISGDTHYAEVSRLETNVPYPLWDFTSSGLTEVWPVLPPNALRVGEAWRERNFGLLDLDWTANARSITCEIRDEQGDIRLVQKVMLDSLSA